MLPDSLPRLWRYINLLLTYDVARLDNAGEKTCPNKLNVQVKNVTVSKHCAN